MKKIQLIFVSGADSNQAGSKAPKDISVIAEEIGFEKISISVSYKNHSGCRKLCDYLKSMFDWCGFLLEVPIGAVVLLQCPMEGGGKVRNFILRFTRKLKRIKYIAVVHDVALLRYKSPQENDLSEFNLMLDITDMMIVHNEVMKQWFERKKVSPNKLIVLNIFDYLMEKKSSKPYFEKSISIAGNLDLKKSGYLVELKKLRSEFILYGPNYDEKIAASNVVYKGSYPPEELPEYLNRGFGLIWDGETVDTCSGDYGNYLRYNNPHKLSLYIASGIPVFIWNEAAEAPFVENNKLGFAISSLKDIDVIFEKLDEKEYMVLADHVDEFSLKLIDGINTKNAIGEALKKIKEKL